MEIFTSGGGWSLTIMLLVGFTTIQAWLGIIRYAWWRDEHGTYTKRLPHLIGHQLTVVLGVLMVVLLAKLPYGGKSDMPELYEGTPQVASILVIIVWLITTCIVIYQIIAPIVWPIIDKEAPKAPWWHHLGRVILLIMPIVSCVGIVIQLS